VKLPATTENVRRLAADLEKVDANILSKAEATLNSLRHRVGQIPQVAHGLSCKLVEHVQAKLKHGEGEISQLKPSKELEREITVTNFDEEAIGMNILQDTGKYAKLVASNKKFLQAILAVEGMKWGKIVYKNMTAQLTSSARNMQTEAHNYIGTTSVLNTIVKQNEHDRGYACKSGGQEDGGGREHPRACKSDDPLSRQNRGSTEAAAQRQLVAQV